MTSLSLFRNRDYACLLKQYYSFVCLCFIMSHLFYLAIFILTTGNGDNLFDDAYAGSMYRCTYTKYEGKVKSSSLAYNRRKTRDKRPLGRDPDPWDATKIALH